MRRPPAGKTLIELLVIITLLSIVLSLAATTLAGLFRTRQRLSREEHESSALARLTSRLRSDAHQAASCEVAEACKLTLPDGQTISYAINAADIRREVSSGGAVIHRDSFPLPRDSTAAFACEEFSGGKLVKLAIRPSETPGRANPMARAVTVEAALALAPKLAGREGRP